MMFPPRLKIWGQPQQIPNLSAKKITQRNFQKKILIFNAASKPLKFSYIVYYSRSTSDNFGNYYTHFQLKFFDGFHIFGILAYNIYNKILNLEQSAHFYFSPTLALLGCKRCKKPKLRINQITPKLKSYYEYDIQGFQKCKNHQKILTRSGCNSFENYLTCIYYSDLCSKTLGA